METSTRTDQFFVERSNPDDAHAGYWSVIGITSDGTCEVSTHDTEEDAAFACSELNDRVMQARTLAIRAAVERDSRTVGDGRLTAQSKGIAVSAVASGIEFVPAFGRRGFRRPGR